MSENKINVCLASDDNYAKYMGVVIASILYNAKNDDELSFYILDGGISEEHKNQILELKSIKDCHIAFVYVDKNLFKDYEQVKTHSYITLSAYYRLKMPSLLPAVKRVIYFDCDFVVNSSLKELFNTEMGNSAIAGVLDIDKRKLKKNAGYVNSGMLVMDLDNMRKQNTEDRFFKWTKEHFSEITCGDQEIINEALKGEIKIVDDVWNVQSSNFTNRSSYTNHPKAIHYVAKKKPWHFGSFSYHRPLYFKYLQMTPWKLDKQEYKHWTFDNQIASLFGYAMYRPLFLFRPRFYKAVYYTYLKSFFEKLFSIQDYNETHRILRIFGIKIKFPKAEYLKKKKQNLFYYYKEKNVDITTIPPAEGQIRDIQLANLALLKELDYVCKLNNLTYWLDAGTLIGAVRHKGYIPWDDDIDTAMKREDYEKITDAFNKTTRNPDIFAGYFRDKKNPCQYIIKIQHKKCPYLFVDIFPWDSFGKKLTDEEQVEFTKYIKEQRQKLENSSSFDMPDIEIKNKIDKSMKENVLSKGENDPEGDFVWGMDFNHTWKNWFTRYDVVYPIKTISFEGFEFPSINNPDAFLTRVYGNYMGYPNKITFGHAMFLNLSDNDKKIIEELKKSVKE